MHLKNKTICYPQPRPETVAYENEYYLRPTGLEKRRLRFLEIADDIYDHGEHTFSEDNGATWHSPQPFVMGEKVPGGTLRRMEVGSFIDPENGLFLNLILEGVLSQDEALDGMSSYYLKYKVSRDGGRSVAVEDYIVQRGEAFSHAHPIEYVYVGKNALMNGAENSVIRSPQGHLVVAAMITPLDEHGNCYNPGGGYTYHEIVILFGHWQSDSTIEWELGPRLSIDPRQSTRGLIEPTLALLPDGRILMVMRGSNGGSRDREWQIPGYKWHCISSDGGHTWSEVQPFCNSNGEPFHSPSSISQLFQHSSGKYFWLGNICPNNPKDNGPRYPLIIAEVDPSTCTLKKETTLEIDTLQPDDHPSLSLSNFSAHEDRENGDILIHLTRMFSISANFEGNAYFYRIGI